MSPSDHRTNAREALRGNWGVAMLVSLLAGIISGGGSGGGVNFQFNVDVSDFSELSMELSGGAGALLTGLFSVLGIVLAILAVALLLVFMALSGVMALGESRYNLNLIDRKEAEVRDLFTQFYRFKDAFVMEGLRTLFITLWSLLLVIPGIVASYSYAMAPYILLEDPYCSGSEALARSKAMMYGNKLDLFLLDLSFFGWTLLCLLTGGIGYLWLNPYQKASRASFYRSLVGGRAHYQTQGPEF